MLSHRRLETIATRHAPLAGSCVGSCQPRGWVCRLKVLVLLIFWLLPAVTAWCGTGDSVVLPAGGKKLKSGWSVEVDFHSVSTNGYRPIRFKASLLPPGTAAKGDRTLRIEIRPASAYYPQRAVTVSQYLELPQGATSGTCTILVPQDRETHSLDVTFYEDGEKLEDLSGAIIGMPMWGGYS